MARKFPSLTTSAGRLGVSRRRDGRLDTFQHQGVHDLDVEDRALDFAGDDTIVEVGLAVLQAGAQSSDQRLSGLAGSTIGEPARP